MHARHSHMVVLRGVGVLLVLLLGSILALVQPASAAPALIATEPPRPPDNVQTDHTGVTSDDPPPPDSTPSAAIPDDHATPPPMAPQVQDPASSEPEAASPPSASDAPETDETDAPAMATPSSSSAPSPGPAPAATPPTDSSVVVTVVDPEDDGFSADGGIGIGDDGMSAEAGAVVATTMAVAIPSAPSIHTLGGLLAYTGAGLGLVLAMVCLLVIGAFALWRSRREETTPAFF